MNEPDEIPKQKYRWPWVALAMVVLGIVLAVIWMSFEVRKVERERDFNTPVQTK